MKKVLISKEIPYLLTLLFVALAWSLTHWVERYTESPAIEWRQETIEKDGSNYGIYDVRNITSKTLFNNLKFTLHLENSLFVYAGHENIPPACGITIGQEPQKIENNNRVEIVEYTVPEFHPGNKLKFSVRTASGQYPKLNVRTANPNCSDRNAILLLERGWKTFIIRYEGEILGLFILFWLLSIAAYLRWLSSHKASPQTAPNHVDTDGEERS